MSSTPSIVFPTVGLNNPAFRYRDHLHSDVRKTFARVRRERAEAQREADTGQGRLDLGGGLQLVAIVRGAK